MYQIINNLKIIVKPEVIRDLKRYYCSNMKYETGGILLGKFNRNNKVIEITEIYELKTTFFSRILYRRNARKAQKIIDKRWRETDGIINYVGEWHTHPCMQAIPSDTDIHSLREIAVKVRATLPGTLLMIIGRDEKINLIVQREDTIKMQLLSEGKRNGE